MTPKEKAVILITEYKTIMRMKLGQDVHNRAKECAITCVNEVLKSFDAFMDYRKNFRHELEIDAERYWLSVKHEITLL